jgi:ABC-type uncharacterized transport system substrate-binding protein
MIRVHVQRTIGLVVLTWRLLASMPMLANPQIWVAVRSEVVFDQERRAVALRHIWEFDEFYSASITGLIAAADAAPPPRNWSAPSDALNALARRGFYTVARLGDRKLAFKPPQDVRIETDARNIVRLRFTLPLETPLVLSKFLLLDVSDPGRGVAFGLEIDNPVTMSGNHAGCSVEIVEPEAFVAAYGNQSPTGAKVTCR